jgi:hypothetical protein
MVSLGIRKKVDEYRDKRLVSLNPDSVAQIEFRLGTDAPFVLVNELGAWKIGNEIMDTAKTVQFVRSLSFLRGNLFADEQIEQMPVFGEVVITPNLGSPVTLKAYEADSLNYLISSSFNPASVFVEDGAFLEKAFVGQDYFKREN